MNEFNKGYVIRNVECEIVESYVYPNNGMALVEPALSTKIGKVTMTRRFVPLRFYTTYFDNALKLRKLIEKSDWFTLTEENPNYVNLPKSVQNVSGYFVAMSPFDTDLNSISFQPGVYYLNAGNILLSTINALKPWQVDLKMNLLLLEKL